MPETPTGARLSAAAQRSVTRRRPLDAVTRTKSRHFLLILVAMATAEIQQTVFLHAALSLLVLRAEGKITKFAIARFVVASRVFRISKKEVTEIQNYKFIVHYVAYFPLNMAFEY